MKGHMLIQCGWFGIAIWIVWHLQNNTSFFASLHFTGFREGNASVKGHNYVNSM